MDLRKLSEKDKQALIQGVIAQFENDLNDRDYTAIDEMLLILLKSKKNATILYNFLGDDIQEKLKEGKLNYKY